MKKVLFLLFTLVFVSGVCIAYNQSFEQASRRGCCSHHGGVAYCVKAK